MNELKTQTTEPIFFCSLCGKDVHRPAEPYPFEEDKGPVCFECGEKHQSIPPCLYKDLMAVPTHKLAEELLHRVKVDKTQLETNTHAFADLSLFWRMSKHD